MQPQWYVIHCEPHRDRQVEYLLAARGLESYSPHILKTRSRNGEKPLFPGYVFARMALDSGVWSGLRFMPGVRGLVEIGGGPCPIDADLVSEVRSRAASYVPGSVRLSPGERIVVKGGAMADLEGVFCEALSGEERVAVLIDMMHRQVRVEMDAGRVQSTRHGGEAA